MRGEPVLRRNIFFTDIPSLVVDFLTVPRVTSSTYIKRRCRLPEGCEVFFSNVTSMPISWEVSVKNSFFVG